VYVCVHVCVCVCVCVCVPVCVCVCVCVRARVSMKEHRLNPVSLRFVDGELEGRYSSEQECRSGVAFGCCCLVLIFITAMEVFIDPR